ncbi:phosphoribosylglycinamide formyltransferase [Kallotenue papyrolyticum]|uniref:phosphoribosylglycinamide formyltransferase n=1 Tax=Kallotenue papyrolyticum TaxID=1325125 RepID=UPI0004785A4D|nr:phosphoribosylglycinamide formyltransferase [Kallotenue papyrolyticum]
MEQPFTVAVLASGSGSNLQALLDDQQGYRVVLVLADRNDAGAIARGLRAGVATACVPLRQPRQAELRAAWERQVAGVIDAFAPDLLVMAGWMRIMSAWFVERYAGRLINQHPALLPDDAGPAYTLADGRTIPALRGAHAVREALARHLPVTGCTVHWVTPEVDAGPALARAEVPVLPDDDEATLHERIKAVERRLIVETVRRLARERIPSARP